VKKLWAHDKLFTARRRLAAAAAAEGFLEL